MLVDLYALMLPDVFRYIGVDGLHPNEAGYARMAELFVEAIQRESRCARLSARGCHLLSPIADACVGDRVAVRDLSLSVAAARSSRCLAPTAPAKTTTMRMLAGLILADAGTVTIDRV